MTNHLIPRDQVPTHDTEAETGHATPHLRLLDGGIPDRANHREQLPLALTWQVSPGVSAKRPLELVGQKPTTPTHIKVPNSEGDLVEVPHPISWTAHMARMVFEVGCGERPSAQLNRWVARDQLSMLALRGQSFSRHPATRAQKGLSRLRKVRGVRAMQVAPGIIEASAVLVGTARSHAIAMRMEAVGNQWMLTAVEMR